MDPDYVVMVDEVLGMSDTMDEIQRQIVKYIRFLIKASGRHLGWKGPDSIDWDGRRMKLAEFENLSWWVENRSNTQVWCTIESNVVCVTSMTKSSRIQGLELALRVRLALPALTEGVTTLIPEVRGDIDRFRSTGTTNKI
ncbi:MAG: hypothetical protein KBC06_00450 [Candidatus Pacebacteria bacterium]|nr:hypothetical protein [Candidatus Paceibacterota bacterium]